MYYKIHHRQKFYSTLCQTQLQNIGTQLQENFKTLEHNSKTLAQNNFNTRHKLYFLLNRHFSLYASLSYSSLFCRLIPRIYLALHIRYKLVCLVLSQHNFTALMRPERSKQYCLQSLCIHIDNTSHDTNWLEWSRKPFGHAC